MAFLSKITYTGDGIIQSFSLPFPYIIKEHIKVYLAGTLTTAYTWTSTSTILMDSVPPNGTPLLIKRETPTSPLVQWQDGATLRAADLNKQALQTIYICQEALDLSAAAEASIVTEAATLAAAQAAQSAINAAASEAAAEAAETALAVTPKDASWITTGVFDAARIPDVPLATTGSEGIVRVGTGLSVASGLLSVTAPYTPASLWTTLAGGSFTRVTSTPIAIGQYRSRRLGVDTAPLTPPSTANGLYMECGSDISVDAINQYDIYVGTNKSVELIFYPGALRLGGADTTYYYATAYHGILVSYEDGVVSIYADVAAAASTLAKKGTTTYDTGFFDLLVRDR